MEAVVERENTLAAVARVKSNQGAPGVDGMTVDELEYHLRSTWPVIKWELLHGLDDLDQELERRGHSFCRYADDCNIYVRPRKAGERVMRSLTVYLPKTLRLRVNLEKSAVGRPWQRKFLGYSMTVEKSPRLRVLKESEKRFKTELPRRMRRGLGMSLSAFIGEVKPKLRGWYNYFRLNEVKVVFERLDEWLRRRLRLLLWRSWKRPRTIIKNLMRRGLDKARSIVCAGNGRGPWWNSGAAHMNQAFPKQYFDELGLTSLLAGLVRRDDTRTAVYGTVRTVV